MFISKEPLKKFTWLFQGGHKRVQMSAYILSEESLGILDEMKKQKNGNAFF